MQTLLCVLCLACSHPILVGPDADPRVKVLIAKPYNQDVVAPTIPKVELGFPVMELKTPDLKRRLGPGFPKLRF